MLKLIVATWQVLVIDVRKQARWYASDAVDGPGDWGYKELGTQVSNGAEV